MIKLFRFQILAFPWVLSLEIEIGKQKKDQWLIRNYILV